MHFGTGDALELALAVGVATATVGAVPLTRRLDAGRFAAGRRTVVLIAYSAMVICTGWVFRTSLSSHRPLAAMGAVFLTTSWFAYAQGLLRLARFLPGNISAGEARLYSMRWSGVKSFGVLLRRSPLRHLNPSVYSRRPGRDFSRVEPRLVAAEIVHSWSGSISAVMLLAWLSFGFVAAFATGFIAWLLEDIYPLLHLRYTRYRLAKVFPSRTTLPPAPTAFCSSPPGAEPGPP
jgi:hypothetical protein